MKRLLQLFLAGVFLLSFAVQARVILPKGGEQWSVGSSVQLQWDATGDTVDIQLIRQGQDPIVIDEDVVDTGHYLWPIEELESARDYKIKVTQGAKTLTSRPFRITAWDAKRYLGEFDENDRSRVTHPRQAAVLDKGNPVVTVNWVDYRHFLKNKVRISLHEVGSYRALGTQTQLDNIGSVDWQLGGRSIKDCTEGLCYFVIRSGRKRNHLITSHSFTLGDVGQEGDIEITAADVGPSEDSDAAGSVLTLGWTGPEGETRIDLYQAGYYHQTIKEEAFSPDDEQKYHLSWPIPATLPGGKDYTVVLTSLADGAKQATSTPFSIEATEDSVTVNSPKDITLTKAAKRARLGWKNTKGPVDIDLYRDGRRVKTIARNTAPNRVHNWPLPGVLAGSDQYTVRVSQADDEGVFGVSAVFSITPPGGGAVAQAPSAKRCQALGLAEDCTAGEATAARLALERDCVTWRLYGTACTRKAVEEVIADLLARADDRPKECQAGWIQIGNQCRPESECPGLALRDEERPQWLRDSREGEKKGRRRCDQNLLKIESSVDLTLAAMLNMMNRLLETKDGDFSELMDEFYADIHFQDSDNRKYRTCRSEDYYPQEVFEYTLDSFGKCCKADREARYEEACDMFFLRSCETEKELKKDRLESEYFQRGLQSPCDPWVDKESFLTRAGLHRDHRDLAEKLRRFIPRDFQTHSSGAYSQFGSSIRSHILNRENWEASTKGMLYWPAHAVVSESAESALPPAARIHARFLRLVAEYQKTRARAGVRWQDDFVSESHAGHFGAAGYFKRAGFRKVEDCFESNEYRNDRCGYDQGMGRIPKEELWPGLAKLFGEEWPEVTKFIFPTLEPDAFKLKEFLTGLDKAQFEKVRQLIEARNGTPQFKEKTNGFLLDFSRVPTTSEDRSRMLDVGRIWEGEQLGYVHTDGKDDKTGRRWIKATETGLKIIPPAGMDHIYLSTGGIGLYNIDPTANFSSRLYPLEAPKPVADVVRQSACPSCRPWALVPFSQQVEDNREWLDQDLPDSEKISEKLIKWAKDKEEWRSYRIDNRSQSKGFISGPTSGELIQKYLDSAFAAKSRSVLSCPAGYGVEDGACKQCAPGYFKPYTEVNSGPCQMCTGNVIAKGQGATSCEVCPFGQVPNRDYTACMSNPCTGKNQYWDLATRRCEKSARKRHKWAYMDLVKREADLRWQVWSVEAANKKLRTMLNPDRWDRQRAKRDEIENSWDESEWVYCVDSEIGMCERQDFLLHRCINGNGTWKSSADSIPGEPRVYFPPRPICQSVSIRPKDKVLNASHRLLDSGEMTNVLRNLLRGSLAQLDVSMAESGQREKGLLTLNVDGHGNGFEAAGIKMTDLRRIIREELGDGRLNLVSYNSCLMGNYESLAMLEGVTDWVIGSTTVIGDSTWGEWVPFDLILGQGSTTGRSPKEHMRWFMYRLARIVGGDMGGYRSRSTFRAYDMDHFSEFREAFDKVLNRLAYFLDTEKTGYLERLEVLSLSRYAYDVTVTMEKNKVRFDIETFLRTFEKDEDPQLRKNAVKALKKLGDLTFASSEYRVGRVVSDVKDKLPFFWTAPRTGLGELGKEGGPDGYPLNPQGNLNPGWEPLEALIRFNKAWEKNTRVSG